MAAVITEAYKRNVIELLKDNVESKSETYYLGIGRPPPPVMPPPRLAA